MSPTRPYGGPVKVLSSLPGRARWRVELLVGQSVLASAVGIDLEAHPQITNVRSSALTGGVLVIFPGTVTTAEVECWLRQSIARQLAALCLPVGPSTGADPVNLRVGSGKSSLHRLAMMTEPHRELRSRAIALSFANGLEDAVPPMLVGLAADTATMGSASLLGRIGLTTLTSRWLGLGAISIGLWLLAAGVEYLKDKAVAKLANAVRHDLRVAVYEHVQTLDIAAVESRDVTDWMAVLDKDVNQVHSFIKTGIDPFFQMATNLAVVGATIVIVSPLMAGVQLLLLPPLVLVSMKLLRPIRQKHIQARNDNERLNAMMAGNVAGMATIASFNAQADEGERVREASDRYQASALDAENIEAVYVPTLRAIAGAGFVTTLVWGSGRVAAGSLSIGVVDTLAMTQLRLLSALARMGVGLDQYQRTSAALDRIYQTLDTAPAIVSGPRPLPATTVVGDVVFDQVVFGYDPARPVLKGLNMRCPAGRTTGIVGASGAGKSTLLKLLMRFWDPQMGTVRLDDVDVRAVDIADLRSAVALVSQQITLFAGTIRDNIAYGNRTATLEQVAAAARTAEAHEFISALPAGYDSPIGFGGLTLSGGQRQRIAIARAVLSDRPLLLFDEATSALDYHTEAALQRSLEVATAGRTTVIVAHRLSMVRHADIIYVINDGVVHESGRHDELIAAGGIYAGMWRVQTGERQTRPPAAARPPASTHVH